MLFISPANSHAKGDKPPWIVWFGQTKENLKVQPNSRSAKSKCLRLSYTFAKLFRKCSPPTSFLLFFIDCHGGKAREGSVWCENLQICTCSRNLFPFTLCFLLLLGNPEKSKWKSSKRNEKKKKNQRKPTGLSLLTAKPFSFSYSSMELSWR